jgi:hypothetical protein
VAAESLITLSWQWRLFYGGGNSKVTQLGAEKSSSQKKEIMFMVYVFNPNKIVTILADQSTLW